MRAVTVNFFAGPSAGKTTAALELTVELKKLGIDVEYVSEYAKELVRRGRTDELRNQKAVTDVQIERIKCLQNSCEVVVTDSPILLGCIYAQDNFAPPGYVAGLHRVHNSMQNLNLFVLRMFSYDQRGRIHGATDALEKDEKIAAMLDTLREPTLYVGGENTDYKHLASAIGATVKLNNNCFNLLHFLALFNSKSTMYVKPPPKERRTALHPTPPKEKD